MSARSFAVDVLLAATVLSEALCVLGVFAGATVYDRLHYAGATASVPPFLVFVAVLLKQPHPYTSPVWNALFVAVALFLLNGVLSHAVARVVRQREARDVEL
ncbi:MAG TPA: monovalent cation/H(+) antiporter subunit G [Gaiellaceae bacterium]|nr:monovalent cation/H(+) antiporter subunit G [Gaiellaceae bacterium]